jgi:hypothetical protein
MISAVFVDREQHQGDGDDRRGDLAHGELGRMPAGEVGARSGGSLESRQDLGGKSQRLALRSVSSHLAGPELGGPRADTGG